MKKTNLLTKISILFTLTSFIWTTIALPSSAQIITPSILNLPAVGTLVELSPKFKPMMIHGVNIYPDDPLKFDFIMDQGHTHFSPEEFREEATRLSKYFLAALTIPEKEMWVNLSPYEKDRIIPETFGQTEMGRDLLAQDYILKQLSSSLMHPEKDLGTEFWTRVYAKAQEQFATTEIPMNTFNKIWIVPEEAIVYEHTKGAFIVKSHLKVMLEDDYLALEANQNSAAHGLGTLKRNDLETMNDISTQLIREILIPEIEKEINQGKTFANLRQIYNAVILATWYKQALKESLLGQSYVDKGKVDGIDVQDEQINQKIYDQYIAAFKKGVYDFIKEDYDPINQEIIPRKYFSGGAAINKTSSIQKIQRRGSLNSNKTTTASSSAVNDDPSTIYAVQKAALKIRETSSIVTIHLSSPKKNISSKIKIKPISEPRAIASSVIFNALKQLKNTASLIIPYVLKRMTEAAASGWWLDDPVIESAPHLEVDSTSGNWEMHIQLGEIKTAVSIHHNGAIYENEKLLPYEKSLNRENIIDRISSHIKRTPEHLFRKHSKKHLLTLWESAQQNHKFALEATPYGFHGFDTLPQLVKGKLSTFFPQIVLKSKSISLTPINFNRGGIIFPFEIETDIGIITRIFVTIDGDLIFLDKNYWIYSAKDFDTNIMTKIHRELMRMAIRVKDIDPALFKTWDSITQKFSNESLVHNQKVFKKFSDLNEAPENVTSIFIEILNNTQKPTRTISLVLHNSIKYLYETHEIIPDEVIATLSAHTIKDQQSVDQFFNNILIPQLQKSLAKGHFRPSKMTEFQVLYDDFGLHKVVTLAVIPSDRLHDKKNRNPNKLNNHTEAWNAAMFVDDAYRHFNDLTEPVSLPEAAFAISIDHLEDGDISIVHTDTNFPLLIVSRPYSFYNQHNLAYSKHQEWDGSSKHPEWKDRPDIIHFINENELMIAMPEYVPFSIRRLEDGSYQIQQTEVASSSLAITQEKNQKAIGLNPATKFKFNSEQNPTASSSLIEKIEDLDNIITTFKFSTFLRLKYLFRNPKFFTKNPAVEMLPSFKTDRESETWQMSFLLGKEDTPITIHHNGAIYENEKLLPYEYSEIRGDLLEQIYQQITKIPKSLLNQDQKEFLLSLWESAHRKHKFAIKAAGYGFIGLDNLPRFGTATLIDPNKPITDGILFPHKVDDIAVGFNIDRIFLSQDSTITLLNKDNTVITNESFIKNRITSIFLKRLLNLAIRSKYINSDVFTEFEEIISEFQETKPIIHRQKLIEIATSFEQTLAKIGEELQSLYQTWGTSNNLENTTFSFAFQNAEKYSHGKENPEIIIDARSFTNFPENIYDYVENKLRPKLTNALNSVDFKNRSFQILYDDLGSHKVIKLFVVPTDRPDPRDITKPIPEQLNNHDEAWRAALFIDNAYHFFKTQKELPELFNYIDIEHSDLGNLSISYKQPILSVDRPLSFVEQYDLAYSFDPNAKIYFSDINKIVINLPDVDTFIITQIQNSFEIQLSEDASSSIGKKAVNLQTDPINGGIDLNPTIANTQIQRNGSGIEPPVFNPNIQNMEINGLVPTIINITPLKHKILPMLGLSDTEDNQSVRAPKSRKNREEYPFKYSSSTEPRKGQNNFPSLKTTLIV